MNEVIVDRGLIWTIRDISDLGKFRITIMVCITSLAGFLAYNGTVSVELIYCLAGMFFLSSGSAALNQIQERHYDAIMPRTSSRPLPAGRLSLNQAVWISLIMSLTGISLLAFGVGTTVLMLGLLTYFWYNVIYTYLKKLTAYAVIPGSVIGALPPVIGYVSAGGYLFDRSAWILALVYFCWQVPHYFLLVLKYGKEYELAGFPSLSNFQTDHKIRMQVFAWVILTALLTIYMAFTSLSVSYITTGGLILSAAWLVWLFSSLATTQEVRKKPIWYFMRINYFILAVSVLLVFDKTIFFFIQNLVMN